MNISELIEMKKAYESAVAEKGKELLVDLFAPFFLRYPDLGVYWTQYTPYFNDGEPCVFSVGGLNLMVPADTSIEGYPADYEDLEFGDKEWIAFEVWVSEHSGPIRNAFPGAMECLADIAKQVSELEDVFRALGDGVEVAALKGEFIVEEYDHD